MKNSWKRLEVLAIGLKNDPFKLARIRLAVLCIFTVFITLIFAKSTDPQHSTFWVYFLIFLIVSLISFLLSDSTLASIKEILRAQKRFISDASHELRTPLAIMKTSSEIALLGGKHIEPEEAKETLSSNIEEIDRMSRIIESLLSLSYYESQGSEVKFEKINLSELVTSTIEEIKVLTKKKSQTLTIIKADPGYIMGSPIAIEQIVINLIKNSIAYTPANGNITVSITCKDSIIHKFNVLELEVKDTGIGISEKDLLNVFHPFYKAERARDILEPESSGLGLTIVKKIVERHKGSIIIKSALGKGTTITIAFPSISSHRV